VKKMHTKQIGEKLFLIDLETCGFKNLIASYVLKGEKTAIIETGPTSSIHNLLLGLKEIGIKPENVAYVFVTHVHIDHSGGAGSLLKHLPNAKVVVHPRGKQPLVDPAKLWAGSQEVMGRVANDFGKPEPIPENRILVADDGMTFDLGNGIELQSIETVGHASHHLSYYEHSNSGIFPGDAAGAYFSKFDAVFPTTPPPFLPDLSLASLEKLIKLNPKALFYSHFGKATDATTCLRNYEAQIRLWLRITLEGVRNNESAEAIQARIFAEDLSIREVIPALMSNPFDRKTLVENSIQGFIDYAEKQEAKQWPSHSKKSKVEGDIPADLTDTDSSLVVLLFKKQVFLQHSNITY
jgi:glyoxylase-like metal-dependent hydrolase (beta-lactamase superfamily II)